MEFFHLGNHGEQFGTHMQYEVYKLRTPQNAGLTTPPQYVQIVNQNLYSTTYLQNNPLTVRPPAVDKINTSFLLYSANTGEGFLSALVSLRVNIHPNDFADNRITLDILPLTTSSTTTDTGTFSPNYKDLVRAYLTSNGNGTYNLQVFVKYVIQYSTYRIRTLHTSLNDDTANYNTSLVKYLTTQYGLYVNRETDYRMNNWLFIPQNNQTIVSETTLPTTGANVTLYSSNPIVVQNQSYTAEVNNVNVDTLLTPGSYYINNATGTNTPNGRTGMLEVIILDANTNFAIQRFMSFNESGDSTYYRKRNSGTWGNWYKDTGNLNIGVNKPVTAGSTTRAVAFTVTEADANYCVTVTPAWNTTYWVTSKLTTGFTINFGTAPVADSTVDWSIKR